MTHANLVRLSGIVRDLEHRESKGGKPMAFFALEIPKPDWMKSTDTEQVKWAVFGRAMEQMTGVTDGTVVEITGRVSGSMGRTGGSWFTNLVAEKITIIAAAQAGAVPTSAADDSDSSVPF